MGIGTPISQRRIERPMSCLLEVYRRRLDRLSEAAFDDRSVTVRASNGLAPVWLPPLQQLE